MAAKTITISLLSVSTGAALGGRINTSPPLKPNMFWAYKTSGASLRGSNKAPMDAGAVRGRAIEVHIYSRPSCSTALLYSPIHTDR